MEKDDNTEEIWELTVLRINDTTGEVLVKPFLLNLIDNPIMNSEPDAVKIGNKNIRYTKVKLYTGRVIKVDMRYSQFKEAYLQKLRLMRISNNNSQGTPVFLN